MISLRKVVTSTVVAVAALSIAACNDGPSSPLAPGIQAGGPSLSKSSSDSDSPTFDGRLTIDKSGNGSLEIRTGTYDPDSKRQNANNGYFSSVTYQVYNGSGHLVQTKKVSFSKSNSQYWTGDINLCSSQDDDDDDDGGRHGGSSCSTKMSSNWRVHITVNGKGWGSDSHKSWSCEHDANDNQSGGGATLPAPTANIEPHVFLDAAGNAVFYVGTGTYNPATGGGTADGTFSTLTYKVYNASNKLMLTKSVSFSKTAASKYSVYVDLCGSTGNDDDDDDDHSSSATHCSSKLASNWKVTVTATVKGFGGNSKSSGSVTEDAVIGYFPDVDIKTQQIFVVGAGGAQTPATSVAAAAPVTYSVAFPNNKPINGVANTLAVDVGCLVFVDNALQLAIPNIAIPNPFTHTTIYTNPNLFSYVSGAAQTIQAGATSACVFSLSLPAGPHKIAVSALVTSPIEYDITNNTTQTFTITASSGPPNVGAINDLQLMDGTTRKPITGSLITPAGSTTLTQTFTQEVALNSLTVPSSITCKVFDGTTDVTPSPAPAVTPLPATVAASGFCQFTLTLSTGNHALKVTAVANPTDGDPSNDSHTTTVTVSNTAITGNLANVITGPAAVLSGATTLYRGDETITSLLGLLGNLPVSCKVYVDNTLMTSGSSTSTSVVVGGAAATGHATMTWDPSNANGAIQVGNNTTGSCKFTLKFDENGNKDVPHTVKVEATAATTLPVTVSTTTTVTAQVRVDLMSAGIFEVSSTGELGPIVSTPMGSAVTFGAVFHNPDSARSIDFTCNILLNGAAPGGDISYTPITTSATAAPGGDGVCKWSVTPQNLQSMPWSVMATLSSSSPIDSNDANNTAAASFAPKSNGHFSTYDDNGTYAQQEWFLPQGSTETTPIANMTAQIIKVNRLALLVIPTNDNLGNYTLKAQVFAPNATFPLAVISGTNLVPSPTTNVDCSHIDSGLDHPFLASVQPSGTLPADLPHQYGYSGQVCTNVAQGQSGFQTITVNFSQSIETQSKTDNVLSAGNWGLTGGGNVDIHIELDFTLPGGQPDKVVGIVRIPIDPVFTTGSPPPGNSGLPNTLRQWLLSSSTAQLIDTP